MKIRLGALIAATAALGFTSTEVGAQDRAWRPDYNRQCVAELRRGDPFASAPESRAPDVAAQCQRISLDNRVGGVRAARARFYAGRAYRMLGGPSNLDAAIGHLEGATSVGPYFPAADFGAEQRAATIELVQAYRLRGRIRDALERLNRTDRGALSPDDPAIAYQRAMLTLADLGAESQSGKEGAFGALRPVFTRSTLSLNPPLTESERRNGASGQVRLSDVEIRNGRALLFTLGRDLGQGALDGQRDARDRAQSVIQGTRAIEYLTAAASVVRESAWNIGAPEGGAAPSLDDMSDVFFKLGNARLRAAGVAPRRNGPDLECLLGARARASDYVSQIREARDAFNAILANQSIAGPRRADAHWGLGCATLAGLDPSRNFEGDLQEAISELERAVGQLAQGTTGAAGRPEYLLTLAGAQFIQGASDRARDNYTAAANALSGSQYSALRSEIYVDIARTHLFRPCGPGDDESQRACISFRNPSPIDISGVQSPSPQAQSALDRALQANAGNGDARLMLAQIYLHRREWRPARVQLDALLEGDDALEEDDVRKSFARYLSSRRETLIRQACLAADTQRTCGGDGALAVRDATRASMNDQTNVDYRLQSCIAIILFGRSQDERYCIANDGQDAQALLLEGMYWLRRAHDAGPGTRQDRWGLSLSAFERGGRLATSGDRPTIYPEGLSRESDIRLNELLRYGERYVRVCAIGRSGDTESASDEVKAYFRLSGMLPCLVRN
ncbi:MAG: tetratricopeptide repeat protein [Phycisphaerales bacterium]|nr:tetratricopeptide repeat protein [Hyphomonadaceae bacterium]